MDFDKQAPSYDRRVGLPPMVAEKIAQAVINLPSELTHLNVLEIGAGTGEIGCEIARLVHSYVAIDNSPGMLKQFRQRCQEKKLSAKIIQADGNLHWPVEAGAVNLIFSSRALHLLNLEHIISELERLSLNAKLWLIVGKVQKAPGSIPDKMRKKMRQLLKQQGVSGRSGKRFKENLLQLLVGKGAEIRANIQVTTWEKAYAPVQSLASWRNKTGLAGVDITDETKTLILNQLEVWAKDYYGDIHQSVPVQYSYEIDCFCLDYSVVAN